MSESTLNSVKEKIIYQFYSQFLGSLWICSRGGRDQCNIRCRKSLVSLMITPCYIFSTGFTLQNPCSGSSNHSRVTSHSITSYSALPYSTPTIGLTQIEILDGGSSGLASMVCGLLGGGSCYWRSYWKGNYSVAISATLILQSCFPSPSSTVTLPLLLCTIFYSCCICNVSCLAIHSSEPSHFALYLGLFP